MHEDTVLTEAVSFVGNTCRPKSKPGFYLNHKLLSGRVTPFYVAHTHILCQLFWTSPANA